jgi:hypothetical protein
MLNVQMSQEQRKKMDKILSCARADGQLVDYNQAAGPFDQLLVAVIALEASYEDPIGVDTKDISKIQQMIIRLLEIYTGESMGNMELVEEEEEN